MLGRIAFVLLGLCLATEASSAPRSRVLVAGWYPWDPYNSVDQSRGSRRLTGLDVELTRAALAGAGYQLDLVEDDWAHQLEGIRQGQLDLAMGAIESDLVSPGIVYSKPYRQGVDALFVRRGAAARIPGRTLDEILPVLRARKFRLGAALGYSYGEAVDTLLANPGTDLSVVRLPTDHDLFEAIETNAIDGFLSDRLVGATVAWRNGLRDLVEEHPAVIATHDVRVMFNSAKVTPEVVEAFDREMRRLHWTGAYHRTVRHYALPLLLADTVDRPWFNWIGVFATCAFAMSGVVLASRERYSVFGAFVLGSLPAIGGGVLRDLVVGRHPIAIIRHPELFLYVAITVFLGWLANRIRPRLRFLAAWKEAGARHFDGIVETFDAMGLAALTVSGVLIALETQAEPLFLWGPLLAVTTTCGGGIMRDIVRADASMAVLRGKLYAEVSIIWALALSLFFYWEATRIELNEIVIAVFLCTLGAFVTRMVALRGQVRAPMF